MANNVRYTAAKRREIAALRASEQEAEYRAFAAMTLEEFIANRRTVDVSTDEELRAWAVVRHAEIVEQYGA